MDILNKITENEYKYFNSRRRACCDDDCVQGDNWMDSRDLLAKAWAPAKRDLYQLFGENLILSKDIEIVADTQALEAEMSNAMNTDFSDSPISQFIIKLYTKIDSREIAKLNNGSYDVYYAINDCVNSKHLLTANKVDSTWCRLVSGNLPNGVKVSFTEGAKVIRILGKVAQAYGLEQEFEEFRLEHSRILNQKKLTGKLCISIHPLDYSTMSDNENGWSSCMSWSDWGEYRQGTVEMMNSPSVIVAYLEDRRYRIDCDDWNSKKWRELFVVTPDFITGIKGYPYQCTQLETIVINWLRELAAARWDAQYCEPYEHYHLGQSNNNNRINFTTDYMYNDFGSRNSAHTHLFVENVNFKDENIYFSYSGYSQCMYCGGVQMDFEHEGCLNCTDCNETPIYCADCGDRIREDGDMWNLDGTVYCYHCYNEHAVQDIFTDHIHDSDYDQNIFIVPTNANAETITKMYNNCAMIIYFPVFCRYNEFNKYFTEGVASKYFTAVPQYVEVSQWGSIPVIELDNIKDEFFELDWVEERFSSREGVQAMLSAALAQI